MRWPLVMFLTICVCILGVVFIVLTVLAVTPKPQPQTDMPVISGQGYFAESPIGNVLAVHGITWVCRGEPPETAVSGKDVRILFGQHSMMELKDSPCPVVIQTEQGIRWNCVGYVAGKGK